MYCYVCKLAIFAVQCVDVVGVMPLLLQDQSVSIIQVLCTTEVQLQYDLSSVPLIVALILITVVIFDNWGSFHTLILHYNCIVMCTSLIRIPITYVCTYLPVTVLGCVLYCYQCLFFP